MTHFGTYKLALPGNAHVLLQPVTRSTSRCKSCNLKIILKFQGTNNTLSVNFREQKSYDFIETMLIVKGAIFGFPGIIEENKVRGDHLRGINSLCARLVLAGFNTWFQSHSILR